jgi:hypothetical protein
MMSMMECYGCDQLIDCDFDIDSLYVLDHVDECWCVECREKYGIKTEFDVETES